MIRVVRRIISSQYPPEVLGLFVSKGLETLGTLVSLHSTHLAHRLSR